LKTNHMTLPLVERLMSGPIAISGHPIFNEKSSGSEWWLFTLILSNVDERSVTDIGMTNFCFVYLNSSLLNDVTTPQKVEWSYRSILSPSLKNWSSGIPQSCRWLWKSGICWQFSVSSLWDMGRYSLNIMAEIYLHSRKEFEIVPERICMKRHFSSLSLRYAQIPLTIVRIASRRWMNQLFKQFTHIN
jgi:hypothetical protein